MPARGCHKKEANKFENLNSVRCVVGLEQPGCDIILLNITAGIYSRQLELGKWERKLR